MKDFLGNLLLLQRSTNRQLSNISAFTYPARSIAIIVKHKTIADRSDEDLLINLIARVFTTHSPQTLDMEYIARAAKLHLYT
jgi:hypothetical protein